MSAQISAQDRVPARDLVRARESERGDYLNAWVQIESASAAPIIGAS